MRHTVHICVFALCALALAPARAADVFVSVDSDGTPRYASERIDSTYVLFLKGPAEPALPKQKARRANTPTLAQRRASLEPLITQAATRHGMDPTLVRAVAHVESGFDARALSPAGASGVMQLMPGTARRYGVSNRADPAQNLDAGVRYLKDLLILYRGNMPLALAAYNSGERSVERYSKNVPPFRETMLYVPQVMARYESYRRAQGPVPAQP